MSKPRVLLVYANPAITATPVTPYGMELIAQVMGLAGCEVTLLAPFIEDEPLAALQEALQPAPDLVGFSVRNLDDALVVRSELGPGDIDLSFYLDEVRPLVAEAVAAVGTERVILGGAAISAGARPVLRYLGATRGLRGPAEDIAWGLAKGLTLGRGTLLPAGDPRVVELSADEPELAPHESPPAPRGWGKDFPLAPLPPTPRMGPYLGLALARGGRVPVRVSAGCDRRCNFCVEARFTGYVVRPRPVEQVVTEIEALKRVGVRRFWLACSELNSPTAAHAKELLAALAGRNLDLMVFLQAAPVDAELLDRLEDAGVDPTALSFELGHLDPEILHKGGGPAGRKAIDKLVELWLARGYDTLGGSILLGSHPEETEETVRVALDAALEIDQALPRGFGLAYATGGRVYPESSLADAIASDWEASLPHLYTLPGDRPDPSFVRPVVHCRPWAPRVLLRHVKAALVNARGDMGPMNDEAEADPRRLQAEKKVNQGIWRIQEGRLQDASEAFEAALALVPAHLEGLAQLSMLKANQLGDGPGALRLLQRLDAALPEEDPRREEIRSAIQALSR
ncbi:MAG: radical SAM protein [Alphaproteobacteria bacterium]|nr:radical SAM protein [Alphaproteobacteria bacterium]MCB9792131.1 radical SAM protein [Alphaproteobacteria bacterium]